MNEEVIITGFSNANREGVTLHTNIPAKLKTGNVMGTTMWVSWDKIGEALIEDYTGKVGVAERDALRNQ